MIRYTVRLPSGAFFHFLTEDRANRFAAKTGGKRVQFSVEMLPPEIRKIINV